MATRSSPDGDSDCAALPDAVPFDVTRPTRLSWELGSRVVDGEEATRRGEWERTDARWAVSVFEVTSNTVVVRVRTPAGRKRFYGAALSALETARTALDAAPRWRRVD